MSNPHHYWLVAGLVIATDKKGIRTKVGFNTLLTTAEGHVTRKDLAKAQETLSYRFLTETEQVKGREITDVYIQGISFLGLMTQEQFHAGFSEGNTEKTTSKQELN